MVYKKESFLLIAFFIIFSLNVVACATAEPQPTYREVLEEYSAEFAEKRSQMLAIADSLPPTGSIKTNTACDANLDPPFMFTQSIYKKTNASILMYDQLLDPDVNLRSSFDISIGENFLNTVNWTGPKSLISRKLDDPVRESFRGDLEDGLDTKYLVVNRIVIYNETIVSAGDTIREIVPDNFDLGDIKNTFTPGNIIIEGFVISLENNAVLCSYIFATELNVEQVKARSDSQAKQYLKGILEKEALKQLDLSLKDIISGTVEIYY